MAEERTRNNEELEKWRKKSNNLEALCRRMQDQGRGQALGDLDGDDEGTESEYDEDYEDDEDDEDISDEGEYELEPNEHQHVTTCHPDHQQPRPEKPVFGPPPPPTLAESRSNGNRGLVNGFKH